MSLFDNKIFNFCLLIIVTYIIFNIFRSMDVEYVYFLSYLLWFVAIGLFAIFLPRYRNSIL
jgi:hypothetical protein